MRKRASVIFIIVLLNLFFVFGFIYHNMTIYGADDANGTDAGLPIECIDCGTCSPQGVPRTSNENACTICHNNGYACSESECCSKLGYCCGSDGDDDGGGGGGGCTCTSDGCDVSCPNPSASQYRRHKTTDSDFVRDCSDPCNPNEYNCHCDNYSNSVPKCTLTLPSSITYDAENYKLASLIQHKSTAQVATLKISDNDEGDRHKIVSVTTSSNCLGTSKTDGTGLLNTIIEKNQRNYQFYVRGLGALDGVVPNLTSTNTCDVTLTIKIKDLVGDSGDTSAYATCSASTKIVYPQPKLLSLRILDNNKNSFTGNLPYADEKTKPTLQEHQFQIVGSNAETVNTATINFSGSGATKTLNPVNTRFSSYVYKMSDKAYFTIKARISDNNGNNSLDFNSLTFGFIKTASGSLVVPLKVNTAKYYGVNADGSVVTFNSATDWGACLSSNVAVCVHINDRVYVNKTTLELSWDIYPKNNLNLNLPGARYWFYVQNVQDSEHVQLLKGNTSTILQNKTISLLDNDLTIVDDLGNRWSTARGGNSFLYLDVTPPKIDTAQTKIITNGTDTAYLQVMIIDENHVDSNYVPSLPSIPIARTYIYAQNERAGKEPGVSNRFLLALDTGNKEIKAQDFGSSANLYGWQCVKNSATKTTCKLKFGHLIGGDNVIYGFCVYDKAGNANCVNSDEGLHSIQVGRNWLKTSLNHVYSYGGFANLPDYQGIPNVSEEPTDFKNLVYPFSATQYASLSTFLLSYKVNPSLHVKWGYNNHYDLYGFLAGGVQMQHVKWQDFMFELMRKRCDATSQCKVYSVSTSNDLKSILQDNSSLYKLIILASSNTINLTGINKYVNNNIITVRNNATLKIYNLLKQNGISSTKDSLLIVAGDNSQVIIDDDPNQGYSGTVDIDIVQSGIIALENARFYVLQGMSTNNRDYYRDSNDKFDRLILHGFVYTQTLPLLERDLVLNDNQKYPSEWIIYDPTILSNLEELLGRRKMQVFNCALVDSPICH